MSTKGAELADKLGASLDQDKELSSSTSDSEEEEKKSLSPRKEEKNETKLPIRRQKT